MTIDVLEIGAMRVRLYHQFLSFREGVNLNFALRADYVSDSRLVNLIIIIHAASFFDEAQPRLKSFSTSKAAT